MQEFRNILEPIFTFSKQHKKSSRTNLIKDLSIIACIQIQRHYMILPPTERNLHTINVLADLFPNIHVINECNPENRQSLDMSIIIKRELNTKQPSIDNLIGLLKKNTIIIKKDDDLAEYIDAMKLGSKLADDKKYVLKQITFYNGGSIHFSSHTAGLIDYLRNKYRKLSRDIEISYFNLSKDGTISFTVNVKTDFDYPVTPANIKLQKNIKEIKQIAKQKTLTLLQNKLPFSWSKTELGYAEVKLSRNDFGDVHIPYGGLTGIYFRFEKVAKEQNKNYVHMTLRKIPLDEFMDFIYDMIIDK
jgi:hypothetical protein